MCGAQVSVAAGAVLAGASPEEVKACEKFAVDIGLAFQGTWHTTIPLLDIPLLDVYSIPRHVKGLLDAMGLIQTMLGCVHLTSPTCRCHVCA
jgi:hypothetical protein